MKLFNVGALRPATGDARASAANDLVQRTLAQHGLLPGTVAAKPNRMPIVNDLLTQLFGASGLAQKTAVMPQGAQFRQDSFDCAAGSRAYQTYVPAVADAGVTGVIMMLHGCTQTPEDFAAGTGMNALAEQHGFIVVYPAQSRGDNAQSCWNWFSQGDQRRGRGEPAILAGLAAKIATEHGVGRDRTFVAGLSAGGAMAAILGETYPDVFAAVGVHSGLPLGAAKDVPSAFAAMGGTILDAPMANGDGAIVRAIVFHGAADATVHPQNGDRVMHRATFANENAQTSERAEHNGRTYTRIIASDATGAGLAEHWRIDGQGHAWSGGSTAGSYTDPKGPDASAEMVRFFFDSQKEVN